MLQIHKGKILEGEKNSPTKYFIQDENFNELKSEPVRFPRLIKKRGISTSQVISDGSKLSGQEFLLKVHTKNN